MGDRVTHPGFEPGTPGLSHVGRIRTRIAIVLPLNYLMKSSALPAELMGHIENYRATGLSPVGARARFVFATTSGGLIIQ